jgi:hypothetical protein
VVFIISVWTDTIWEGDSVSFTDVTLVVIYRTRFTDEITLLTDFLVFIGILSEWTVTSWWVRSGRDTSNTEIFSVFTSFTLSGTRFTFVT